MEAGPEREGSYSVEIDPPREEMAEASPARQPVEAPQIRRARRVGLALLLLGSGAASGAVGLVMAAAEAAERAWAAGSFLFVLVLVVAGLQLYWSAYRAWGWTVYGAWLWLALVAHGGYWQHWPGWAHGLALGLLLGGPVRALRYYRRRSGPETLLLLVAGLWLAGGLGVALLLMAGAAGEEWLDVAHRFGGSGRAFWGWLAGAAGMALLASIGLFRPAFALACEPLLWLMYAVRWRGGEEGQVPAHGPCLVIANHACWGDPLFLEKVLPRPTTPMMTSRFYDLPVLRFWMRHFGVIRVPEQPLKKETPEVQEAIAALKRGECLVIFPEGYLRRREEQPLRRFGRGIWLILRACPQVPIFACWIEGNWGSYTSYWNGPPTKNKRPDFRRPIRIAVTGPHWVSAAVLADHWQTRFYLMDLVDAARQQLGLPPLGPFAHAASPTQASLRQNPDSDADGKDEPDPPP